MTFHHLNRRTHLYLALFLSPWFLMYGLSSIPFSHNQYFEELDKAKGIPLWTKRAEIPFDQPVPAGPELRPFAEQVVKLTGLTGAYGAYRQSPKQVNVYVYTFWKSTQVKYFLEEKKLVVEDRRFRWDHFLTGMHAKGGFDQGGWHNAWGVVVDLVCLGMLLWIATGLIMWWNVPVVRNWGWVALASGVVSFGFFLWKL
ncbi:MAG: hypothetical protein IT162_06540 [Bryobacterales bacterium]|nr:hypothetical protein [Bryobacterales bacterium]